MHTFSVSFSRKSSLFSISCFITSFSFWLFLEAFKVAFAFIKILSKNIWSLLEKHKLKNIYTNNSFCDCCFFFNYYFSLKMEGFNLRFEKCSYLTLRVFWHVALNRRWSAGQFQKWETGTYRCIPNLPPFFVYPSKIILFYLLMNQK